MTASALRSLLGSLLPALTLTNHEGCGCEERECVDARRARRAARLAVVNALAELSGEVLAPTVDGWLAAADAVFRAVHDCRVTNRWTNLDGEPVLDRAVATRKNGCEYACAIRGETLAEVQAGTSTALEVVLTAVRMDGEVVKPCNGVALTPETTTCRAEDIHPPTGALRFKAMSGSAFDTEPPPLLALCSCGDPLCDDRCGKAAP